MPKAKLFTSFIISLFLQIKCSTSWELLERPLHLSNPDKDGVFTFNLVVEHRLSMSLLLPNASTPVLDYSPETLEWIQRDPSRATECGMKWTFVNATNGTEVEKHLETLIQLNGKHRLLNTFNGKSPGPTIVVPLGAEVVLRVKNRLHTQSLTVHVHGVDKKGRWWTDGVPFVQQCPIVPNTDYSYRFIADTPGTHWYHGHLMADSGEGLIGGFVVLRPEERMKFDVEEKSSNFTKTSLTVGRQYLALIQDLSTADPTRLYLDRLHWRRKWIGHSLDDKEEEKQQQQQNQQIPQQQDGGACERVERTFDGTLSREVPVSAILVGSKGWHNQSDILERPSKLPLSNFGIKPDENILLRLVNAGISQGVFVWLENHDFWAVAADGSYIKPVKVDSLLMFSGERYDILVKGLSSPKQRVYRMIFELMEQKQEMKEGEWRSRRPTVGLANLFYENLKEDGEEGGRGERKEETIALFGGDEVDWTHRRCTQNHMCLVLNCPFAHFPPGTNLSCLHADKLEGDERLAWRRPSEQASVRTTPNAQNISTETDEKCQTEESSGEAVELAEMHPRSGKSNEFVEIFANLHDGLNGWRFLAPQGIPYFRRRSDGRGASVMEAICDESKCDRWSNDALFNPHCQCFLHFNFSLGQTVQIIAVSAGGMPHPFHLHGHKFVILRMGFAEQHPENGTLKSLNKHLECVGNKQPNRCAELRWANSSWSGGDVPNLIANPVLRDTIVVPAKGFVVTRFKATNPGWFFAHCHLLMHSMDGMNFAFRVGNEREIPAPPRGFPHQCGIYEELPIGTNLLEDLLDEEECARTSSGSYSAIIIQRGELLWLLFFSGLSLFYTQRIRFCTFT